MKRSKGGYAVEDLELVIRKASKVNNEKHRCTYVINTSLVVRRKEVYVEKELVVKMNSILTV